MFRIGPAILCLACLLSTAAAQDDALPIPTKEQLIEARKLIREVFEVDKANTLTERSIMARKLLNAASETKDDPASRYALLDEACSLAADAGDAPLAMDAVTRIKRFYGAPVSDRTAEILTTLVRTAPDARPLVDLANAAVDTAIAEDDLDAAAKLAAAAQSAARKVKDLALVRKAGELARDVRDLKSEYNKAELALAKLEEDPLDPKYSTAAGRYYCLIKGDWNIGLSMLAFSDDQKLASQARKDLEHPSDSAQQVEVGDGWWDLGQAESGKSKDRMLARAGAWYRQALPNLAGLTLKKVEVRLKEVPDDKSSGILMQSVARFEPQNVKQVGQFTGHTGTISSLAFSPDGLTLASGSYDDTVMLWDGKTGKPKGKLTGHTSDVRSVAFAPNGKLLASGSNDRSIKLWDPTNGTLLATMTGHTRSVCDLVFSPDSQVLASASDDYSVRLWNPLKATQLAELKGHERFALSVDFSPNGALLASAGWDQTIRLWSMKTGATVKTLTGEMDNVMCARFSPDGQKLVSGGYDQMVRVWDVSTGKPLHVLSGHQGYVYGVQFSPDGGTIASVSRDATVRLWDAATGQLVNTLTDHTGAVVALDFHPNGKFLATGAQDDTIILWGF